MNVQQLSTMTEAELHARANAHLEHLNRENESEMTKQHHATQVQAYLAEIDRRKQAQERIEREKTAKPADFPVAGGIAVNVKTKRSDGVRVIQLPATVLQSVKGPLPNTA